MAARDDASASDNLLNLICDLIEHSSKWVGGGAFLNDASTQRLIAVGLLRPGKRPRTIACRQCDGDHSATPEYDSATKRFFHFCPVAGRVDIEPSELERLEVCARLVVDSLIRSFPVLPVVGRELATDSVWHLGDAIINKTSLTLIFACRIQSHAGFDALLKVARATPATEIGLIITTSLVEDTHCLLPDRYIFANLRDIARVVGSRIEIHKQRITAHVNAWRRRLAERRGGGRPSNIDQVAEAYRRRRQEHYPYVSLSVEARAIIAELCCTQPDRKPPGFSTVCRHLRQLRSA